MEGGVQSIVFLKETMFSDIRRPRLAGMAWLAGSPEMKLQRSKQPLKNTHGKVPDFTFLRFCFLKKPNITNKTNITKLNT